MLPLKAVAIAIVSYSFVSTPWLNLTLNTLDIAVEMVQYVFCFYVLACAVFAVLLLNTMRLPLAIVQWTVVTSSLVDGLFISGMALLTGGQSSILFWLFVGLIIRNAISIPSGVSQLVLNFAISLCYVLMNALDVSIISGLDDTALRSLDLPPHENWG